MGSVRDTRLVPRAARVQAEETFGERIHDWVVRAGAKVQHVADALGMHREELYPVFDGRRQWKGAWTERLPDAVLRHAAEYYADLCGLDLRPRTDVEKDRDACATTSSVVHEACDLICRVTSALADQRIDRLEAVELLAALDDLEQATARLRPLLQQVKTNGATPLRRSAS